MSDVAGPGRRPLRRFIPHAIVASVALLSILFPVGTSNAALAAAAWYFRYFDWLTLVAASGAVIFCAVVALTPFGRTRIGGPAARPEFRALTWFAMLFASGMGAGLVFWGAAEPLIFYLDPPPGGPSPQTPAARYEALALTQFHWSIHAWGVYAAAALAIGVAAGAAKAPLPSSPFPEAPRRLARAIDWMAVFAVIFGIVASLGAGAIQLGAGLDLISGGRLTDSAGLQILALFALTAAFLVSAAAGLRRGIAILSNINMGIAVLLAFFVLTFGPTGAILSTFAESLGAYAERILSLSTTLRETGEARAWTRDWSLTYFLWWIAWTPFVGVFIARVSYGRTLRAFVLGVVMVPVALTVVWFSIFGGAALHYEAAGIDLGVRGLETAQLATYAVLDQMPLARLSQVTAFVLVFIFLLTSADSGAYVLGMFSSGHPSPAPAERLFWGAMLSLLTAGALLSEGGQTVTRAFAVTGAVPLTVLLVAQMANTLRRRAGRHRQEPGGRGERG